MAGRGGQRKATSVWYDRRVSDELREALAPGGALHRLVSFTRGRHLADLQLRKARTGSPSWVSVYGGLTKFLDVQHSPSLGFRVIADKRYMGADHTEKLMIQPLAWSVWQPLTQLTAQLPAIEEYLTAQFKNVADRYVREGAVQAMLCAHGGEHFRVVDREAVLNFHDTAERKKVYADLRGPLTEALVGAPIGDGHWWNPPLGGGELDVLALNSNGRLLLIEVKGSRDLKGISWAALQVTFYAKLFRHWMETVGETSAASSIEAMLQQRIDIGLEKPAGRTTLSTPLKILPVVAIEEPPHVEALRRLRKVQERMVARRVGEPELEVWSVSPSVRIDSTLGGR